ARSWTGELVFRAAIEFGEREALLTSVEASRAKVMDDLDLAVRMVDFLVKTHLYRQEAPHPVPRDYLDDKKAIALYSFSEYGWCPSCVARSQISRENAGLGALVFTQFSQHFSGAQSSGDTTRVRAMGLLRQLRGHDASEGAGRELNGDHRDGIA